MRRRCVLRGAESVFLFLLVYTPPTRVYMKGLGVLLRHVVDIGRVQGATQLHQSWRRHPRPADGIIPLSVPL